MNIDRAKQFIYNLFSKVFILFRYRNKSDAFRLFKKNIRNEKYLSIDKKRGIILITPIRVSPISNLFEALIGKFYEFKGYDVRFLLCNQTVNYCENIDKCQVSRYITCALCKEEQKRFKKYFSIKAINANDYISKTELKEIREIVRNSPFSERSDFIYCGVDLYKPIISAVMRFTLKSDIIGDELLIKKFAKTAFIFSRVTSNIFKSFQVDKLITSHGIYSTWGSILETAKYYKTKSIVWGRGYIGQGKLLFAYNQSLQRDFSIEQEVVFKERILTEKHIEMIRSYYDRKSEPEAKVDYVNYYNNLKIIDYKLELSSRIKMFTKSFGMFTNIPWDGEIEKTTRAFPTTRIFVKTVIDWFIANKDCLLIIRAHPAEVTREDSKGTETFEELLFGLYPILPENVIFIKPDSDVSSYEVSKLVDAIVLFGSTMSLELALQRNIVIQGGMNYVSNKKIVFDCATKEDLQKYLNLVRLGKLKITDEMYENALKYADYWLFSRHIEDTSVTLNKLVFEKFNFNNKKDFMNDKTLNFVYDKIENNEKITYE